MTETQNQTTATATKPLWENIKIPVLGVSGEKGSGKTLYVSSIRPNRTAMIDLEESSVAYNIPYAKRWNLYEEMLNLHNRVPKPIEVFEWFKSTIENIEPGEYDVLGVDPITDVEQGMVDWVKEHPEKFGRTKAQYDKASGLMWADVKNYWKMLLGILSAKVQTFAFTAHMGAVWKGNSPTGRRAPKGKETLFELASLYLLLERKPNEKGVIPEVPSAVVLKSRLAITSITEDGEVEHHPILPPRLPKANPAAIREYIKNPPNYNKLKKDELVVPEQLSDDDKLLLRQEIANAELEKEQLESSRLDRMRAAAEEHKRQKEAKAEGAAQRQHHQAKSNGNQDDEYSDTPEGIQNSGDPRHLLLVDSIKKCFGVLRLSAEQIRAVLEKRGAKKPADLTIEQADELHKNLEKKIREQSQKKSQNEDVPF